MTVSMKSKFKKPNFIKVGSTAPFKPAAHRRGRKKYTTTKSAKGGIK